MQTITPLQQDFQQEFEQISTAVENFCKLIDQFKNDMKEFIDNLYIQEFQQHKDENNTEALKRGELMYDQFYETKTRCDRLTETRKKINDTMSLFNDQFKAFDEKMLKHQITINECDKRFTNQLLEMELKRINEKEMLKGRQDRLKQFKKYLNENEIAKLEEWCGGNIDNLCFDSDRLKWEQKKSQFDQCVLNKANLLFIVEADNGYKFGSYIDVVIDRFALQERNYEGIIDPNAFVFALRPDYMEKFRVKSDMSAMRLLKPEEPGLFIIGKNDICIKKENHRKKCVCLQNSFDYRGATHCLIENGKEFRTKRVLVFQIRKINLGCLQYMIPEYNHRRILRKWTNKYQDTIELFDSDKENWKDNDCQFTKKILGKNGVVFMIQNEGSIFGCYIDQPIKKDNAWIIDNKAFMFAVKENEIVKYDVTPSKKPIAIKIYDNKNRMLVTFGENDISIYKQNMNSVCSCDEKKSYQYESIETSFSNNPLANSILSSIFPPLT